MPQSDEELRLAARKRLEKKAGFWKYLGVAAAVSLLLIAIWAFSGYREYFWPAWPILGLSVAAVFSGIDAFGPGRGYITDEKIDAEVRKMTGGGTAS
ncbi:2TM domain-containing protein [Herbiconiux sp. L3-i23]|uniref:2TM domain-containing protein n=1 Tax=Herbiconiux sp. L3-i23 TaxID=2905871 RepID=UPI00204BEA4E|nr:2TM domain-containing protein [Herbiconiux sp. L3-i23]BDI22677.1 hypothetical protein L3i23_14530 [Herbiconiux sp. L3-i23]